QLTLRGDSLRDILNSGLQQCSKLSTYSHGWVIQKVDINRKAAPENKRPGAISRKAAGPSDLGFDCGPQHIVTLRLLRLPRWRIFDAIVGQNFHAVCQARCCTHCTQKEESSKAGSCGLTRCKHWKRVARPERVELPTFWFV